MTMSCPTARAAMRRFLRLAGSYKSPNGTSITYRGRTFWCYASRPDGEGWDYHCNGSSPNGTSVIDYGAGRRF
jgi:hypothetical protein